MKKILVAGIVVVAIAAGIGLFAVPALAGGICRSGNTRVDAIPPCCTTTAPVATVNASSGSCCNP